MKLRSAKTAPWLVSLCLALPACGAADMTDDPASLSEKTAAETQAQTYLVLYKALSVPKTVSTDVSKAGGSLIASYPEIGIAIASSASTTFVSTLSKSALIDTVTPTQGAAIDSLPSVTSHVKHKMPKPPTNSSGEPLASMQWNMRQIHADEARAITPGSKNVVVGVFDSGIDDRLVDLQGQVSAALSVTCVGGAADTTASRWRDDEIGHGTHVAGIIGAKQNGHGVVGIAPGATLAAVKLTEDGFVYPEAFICGMYWAATHNFDLVNASLFIDPFYYNCKSDPQQRALTIADQRVLAFAASKGVTVFAAASNEEQDLANPTQDVFSPTNGTTIERTVDRSCKLLPVELPGVVGVSATASNSQLAYYSNYGLGVIDISAPGGDLHVPAVGNESGQIVSTIPSYSYYYNAAIDWNGRVGIGCTDGKDPNDPAADPSTCKETYAVLQGTSQATPHAVGVAALALSRFGKVGSVALLAKMALSATQQACPSAPYQPFPADMPTPEVCQGPKAYNGFYGVGQVDALATVKLF